MPATRDAAGRAVTGRRPGPRAITSTTGSEADRPTWGTSCCCAIDITGWRMKESGRWSKLTRDRSWRSRPSWISTSDMREARTSKLRREPLLGLRFQVAGPLVFLEGEGAAVGVPKPQYLDGLSQAGALEKAFDDAGVEAACHRGAAADLGEQAVGAVDDAVAPALAFGAHLHQRLERGQRARCARSP